MHRPVILARKAPGCARKRRLRIALLYQRLLALERTRLHPGAHPGVAHQGNSVRPTRLQRPGGRHRVPFRVGDNAKEVLHPDNLCAGNRLYGSLVDIHEFAAHPRRPHDRAVQHAGDDKIVHERMPPGHLGGHVGPWNRFADDDVLRWLLQRRFRVDLQTELPIADEFADPNACAARSRPYFVADNLQFVARFSQAFCAENEQRLTRRRGRLANFDPAAHHAAAAPGGALIRREGGVALDHRDAVDRAAQFFCRHLRDGDTQSLPQIDFAAKNRHAAVRIDRQKAVDFIRRDRLAQHLVRVGHALCGGSAGEREAHDEGASSLDEVAPRKEDVHALAPDARTTAFRMR